MAVHKPAITIGLKSGAQASRSLLISWSQGLPKWSLNVLMR
jgi:hypothetical protein